MSILALDSGFFSVFHGSSPECSLYHEDIHNRSNLLVTVGDSWTWGDSIGGSSYAVGMSDPNRTNLIYGRHLQTLIGNCDWINIAQPGTANRWIVDSAMRFVNLQSKLNYQKIYLIVGLTDMTRDHQQRGYHLDSNNKFLDSVRLWEKEYFSMLRELAEFKKIVPVVTRNFTNSMDSNVHMLPFHLTKRWIDISADNWNGELSPGYSIGMNLPDSLDADEKVWAVTQGIPQFMQVISFLNKCPLHYKKASKHPNEQNHELWARYIYSNLTI